MANALACRYTCVYHFNILFNHDIAIQIVQVDFSNSQTKMVFLHPSGPKLIKYCTKDYVWIKCFYGFRNCLKDRLKDIKFKFAITNIFSFI